MLSDSLPRLLAEREGSFWFPPQASSFAQETDDLFMYILYISIFFFVVVVAAMIWCVVKYRSRPGYRGDSTALHNNALEITWTIIPTIVVCWIFARGVFGYMDMMQVPPETLDINVEAIQWNFAFVYPNGAKSAELHLPVDTAIRLNMRSADVLHAFYVPAFRAKTDIVPGRLNTMWFRPIRIGEYPLYCAEYCGDKHSEMKAKVVVHTKKDYEAWVAKEALPPKTPVAHGEWLYERVGCKACHSVDGSKAIGPSFAKDWGSKFTSVSGAQLEVNAEYVNESILKPLKEMRPEYAKASQMPSFLGKLKAQEVDALIAFIKALADGEVSDEERNAGVTTDVAPAGDGSNASAGVAGSGVAAE